MKALVMEEYGRFAYKDVETPRPGPGEVLVRVMACSICGSDVHGMDGSTGRRIPPVIMGHEAAGVVRVLGDGVSSITVGTRVTFDSTVYCGRCAYCARGEINLCEDRRVLGVSCSEYRCAGAFAEYIAVPVRILYTLQDTVTFEQASMVEPLSVALHAFRRTKTGQGVAVVVGCGTIGLLLLQILKNVGYKTVIVSDIADTRLNMALELGADRVVNPQASNLVDEVFCLTKGAGADISFDAVGVESSVRDAVSVLRKGGECVLVGNLRPDVSVPLQHIVTRQITLFGSCATAGEYPECLDLIAAGKVNVDSLISQKAPLAEGNDLFHRLYSREAGLYKVVLLP